jgi:hypothetical protein
MNHRVWAILIGGLAIVLVAVPVIAYFKKQSAAAAPPAPGSGATTPTASAPTPKPMVTPSNADLGTVPACGPGSHLDVDAGGNLVCVANIPSQLVDPTIPLIPGTAPAFNSGASVDESLKAQFLSQMGA